MFLLSLDMGDEQHGLHNTNQGTKFHHKIHLNFISFEFCYK